MRTLFWATLLYNIERLLVATASLGSLATASVLLGYQVAEVDPQGRDTKAVSFIVALIFSPVTAFVIGGLARAWWQASQRRSRTEVIVAPIIMMPFFLASSLLRDVVAFGMRLISILALPFVMIGDPLLKVVKWLLPWAVPIGRQPFMQPYLFIRISASD